MFNGSIVLITGAASGIGLETAKQFGSKKATVIGVDINESLLEEAAASMGERFFPRICDITRDEEVRRLAADIQQTYGKLDVLVNNAGSGTLVNLEQMQEAEFYFHYDVNVKGPMLMSKHCIPLLRKSPNPSILNVSSSAAVVEHTKNHFLYSTAKAALLKFTRHLVRDFPGIRANAVLPGWVDTPIYKRLGLDDDAVEAIYRQALTRIPANRIGTPEDIANCILFLSSDNATYINGAVIDINGGLLCNGDWGFLF